MTKGITSFPAGAGKRGRTLDVLLTAAQELLLVRTAGSLSITDVAARAGVAQGTFYNYFESIDGLIDALGQLLGAQHALMLRAAVANVEGPVEIFSIKTRQTLHGVADASGYGRLLFDAGLPVDRFAGALRDDLYTDIVSGAAAGAFRTDDTKLAASVVAGCILGVALDLHRRRLTATAINAATYEMLRLLGVPPAAAKRSAYAKIALPKFPPLPLAWLSLVPAKTKARA